MNRSQDGSWEHRSMGSGTAEHGEKSGAKVWKEITNLLDYFLK